MAISPNVRSARPEGRKSTKGVAPGSKKPREPQGLHITRFFTAPGHDPFDGRGMGAAHRRHHKARAERSTSSKKTLKFRSLGARPRTNVVVQKYFRGQVGTPQRERSVSAAHRSRGRHHRGVGPEQQQVLRDRGAMPPPSGTSSFISSSSKR